MKFDLINKLEDGNEYKRNSTKYASYVHYPHQHSKFCGICIEKFEFYREHIDSVKHREKTKVEGDRVYKRLTNHFKSIRETVGAAYQLSDPSIQYDAPSNYYVAGFSNSNALTSVKQDKVSIAKSQTKIKLKEKAQVVKGKQEIPDHDQLMKKRGREDLCQLSKSNSTAKSKTTNNCSSFASCNSNQNESSSELFVILNDCEFNDKITDFKIKQLSVNKKKEHSSFPIQNPNFRDCEIRVVLELGKDITFNEDQIVKLNTEA